ncbi:hypothetical protein [Chitinophaga sp. HK235]|uniref:hypothetical protein n=1 Tax=Chitinophaga sp. HK235 TaxID=2952571 RepID=UPI001BACAFF9|nr:hypothetical protein [Chitinophaga sp. HK235]
MLKVIELGRQLSKKEMRDVKGGGTCCAHYNTGCADTCGPASCCGGGNLTMAEAKEKATEMALEPGSDGASWCCSSCNTLC